MKEKFNDRLKALIEKRNVTQASLSEYLNVGKDRVSRLASGKVEPTTGEIAMLCRYFDCTADYLLGLTDIPEKDRSIATASEVTGLSVEIVKSLKEEKAALECLTEYSTDPEGIAIKKTGLFINTFLNTFLGDWEALQSCEESASSGASSYCAADRGIIKINPKELLTPKHNRPGSLYGSDAWTILSRTFVKETISQVAEKSFNKFCWEYRLNYEEALYEQEKEG